VLLLSASTAGCGGSYSFTPKGEAASAAPAPLRSSKAAPAAKEDLAFPSDLRVVYEATSASGDGAPAVRAFRDVWRRWWYAVATDGQDTRYRDLLSTQPGSQNAVFERVVAGWAGEKVRPVGVIRAHDVQVYSATGARVTLVACGDESRAGTKSVTTGQVSWSFGQRKASRYKMRIIMTLEGNRWRVYAYQAFPSNHPAAKECQA
jgi:hypothetical protein